MKVTSSSIGSTGPFTTVKEPESIVFSNSIEGSEGLGGCCETEIIVGLSVMVNTEVSFKLPITSKQISISKSPSAMVSGLDPDKSNQENPNKPLSVCDSFRLAMARKPGRLVLPIPVYDKTVGSHIKLPFTEFISVNSSTVTGTHTLSPLSPLIVGKTKLTISTPLPPPPPGGPLTTVKLPFSKLKSNSIEGKAGLGGC